MGYKQGRFAFRYTGFAYQKGADGEPETIPKDAETIRMIAQNFLNGDSLKRIKEKLEDAGIPAPAGRQQWQTQAILRILQNEKYAGDVLLQKTYTSDFLEGKVKKNNGELPQYYIQNNHPAILPREVFLEIQEELARRRSKKPASAKKSKTNHGRFTSKYALSERLVCGNCGSYYRRVTWSIHGRKQIVWRCLSRLEFGPKACGASPTLEEGALHAAILAAIRSLVQGRQTEMTATLHDTLSGCATGGEEDTSPMLMENKLKALEQEFDQLLILAADGDELMERRLQKVSESILKLKQQKKQMEQMAEHSKVKEHRTKEIMELISDEDLDLTEYSDTLVYRIVEKVTVLSKEEIRIRFVGGFEATQRLI